MKLPQIKSLIGDFSEDEPNSPVKRRPKLIRKDSNIDNIEFVLEKKRSEREENEQMIQNISLNGSQISFDEYEHINQEKGEPGNYLVLYVRGVPIC